MTHNPNTLTVIDAIELLVSSYNKEVEQNDEQVGTIEQLYKENESMANLLKEYEKNADVVLSTAKKTEQLHSQAIRERDQALNKAKDNDILLRAFKEIAATPKKVREKIKGYQDRLEKQRITADHNKKLLSQERRLVASLRTQIAELENRVNAASINQVYRDDKDIIQTYPYHLGDMLAGHDPKMTPLLYLHQSGRGGLIILDEEGEAQLVPAPKGGMRPKQSTLEHCGQWLRRMKDQNWEVKKADLLALSNSQ